MIIDTFKNFISTCKLIFSNLRIFPRNIYIRSQIHLVYVDITKSMKYIFFFMTIAMLLIGYLFGSLTTVRKIYIETPIDLNVESKHDYAVGDIEWVDSIFTTYNKQARLYLKQPQFKGTPLNADIMSLAARNAYDSIGIIVPLELALAQCQWESGMGMKGRSPINNPYTVGEHDDGTVLYFESTFLGVQAYYYLIASNYLRCRSLNELFIRFVDCNGRRYASRSTYESIIKREYYRNKIWIYKNYEE